MARPERTTAQRMEHFWSFVSKSTDPNGCWTWTGFRMPKGYGNFRTEPGVSRLAHRFAYAAFVAPIPEGLQVCHRCDNPPCVRPEHLFLGTVKDNALDAKAKGRLTGGPRPRPLRKLTLDAIETIRGTLDTEAQACYGKTARELAIRFGVSTTLVYKVARREHPRSIQ